MFGHLLFATTAQDSIPRDEVTQVVAELPEVMGKTSMLATDLNVKVWIMIVLGVLSLALLLGLGAWMFFLCKKKEQALADEFTQHKKYLARIANWLAERYQDGLNQSTAARITPEIASAVERVAGTIIDSKHDVLRHDLTQLAARVNEAHAAQQRATEDVNLLMGEVQSLQQAQACREKILDSIEKTIRDKDDSTLENARLQGLVDSQRQRIDADNQKQEEQRLALEQAQKIESELRVQIAEMTSSHNKQVADLNNNHEAKIAELTAENVNKLAEKDAQMQRREAELLDAYRDFTQPDIASMFGFSLADAGQGGSLKTVVYSYLAFLGRNMRENDFIRRFGVFDQELYHALRDDSDALERCRRNVERHIETWNREGCRLIVEWAQLGSVYNDDLDNAEGGSGTQVDGVLRARIFAVDELGNRVCKAKGLVVTA